MERVIRGLALQNEQDSNNAQWIQLGFWYIEKENYRDDPRDRICYSSTFIAKILDPIPFDRACKNKNLLAEG
jgi:hypothetical protein